MTCDMYPDLGLKDIIKILEKKDCKRLVHTSYSTDGIEIPPTFPIIAIGICTMTLIFIMENFLKNPFLAVFIFMEVALFMRLRRFLRSFVFLLLREGVNVVNINYRLLPRVTLKIQVDDVLDGIIYINEKSIRLNVNPRKFFLASDSAGSLLSLAALAFDYVFPTTVYT